MAKKWEGHGTPRPNSFRRLCSRPRRYCRRGQGRVLEESACDGVVVKTSPSLTRVNLSYNSVCQTTAPWL